MPVRRRIDGSHPSASRMSVLSLLRPHSGWRVKLIISLELIRYALDEVNQLIDADHFVASDVER